MHFCLIFIFFLEKELNIKNNNNFLHNKKIVTHGNILHVTHGNKGMLQMVTLINSIQYRYLVNIYNIGSHMLIQALVFLFYYYTFLF
jgi:hypothetical protein